MKIQRGLWAEVTGPHSLNPLAMSKKEGSEGTGGVCLCDKIEQFPESSLSSVAHSVPDSAAETVEADGKKSTIEKKTAPFAKAASEGATPAKRCSTETT